jgi:hypothetical protein
MGKHNVLETEPVSILKWKGEIPTLLGYFREIEVGSL